jgi:hypothetical protein
VQLLTPLFLVSLFIERALEVFVTSWRGEESDKIDIAVATAKRQLPQQPVAARPPVQPPAPGVVDPEEDLMARQLDLARWKAGTRRIAFVGGVIVGILVSALGVRALQLFVDPAAFANLSLAQQRLFAMGDVLLTGAAIGGGADGMHKLVSVFTNFMDAAARRAQGAG